MNFFICKNCGHSDNTSSDAWSVSRDAEGDAHIVCPKCNERKFFKLTVTVENAIT